jgi:hypothetical protein
MAVEEAEGYRGGRGPYRGQKAVEEISGDFTFVIFVLQNVSLFRETFHFLVFWQFRETL